MFYHLAASYCLFFFFPVAAVVFNKLKVKRQFINYFILFYKIF